MTTLARIQSAIRRFHRSERADIPVGTILVVAFIVVPLVLMLIIYRKQLVTYFKQMWTDLMNKGKAGAAGT